MKWKLISTDNKFVYCFDTKHPKFRLVDYIYGGQCLNLECSGKLRIHKNKEDEFECIKCGMLSKLHSVTIKK